MKYARTEPARVRVGARVRRQSEPSTSSSAGLMFSRGLAMESLHEGTFNAQAFLDSAGTARTIVEYRRAEVIFSQGDPCESVFYIQEGGVRLSVLSKTGREAVVAMLGPGDFFGEGCLAGQLVRMGSATAITRSTILVIDKDQMVRLLHKQPALSDRFLAHMLSRNIRIEADLVDQLFNSSEKRLARTLLLLAHYGQEDKPSEGRPAGLAGDVGGNRRHDAIARQFLYEQIQATGVHRIQGWAQGQQVAAHRRLTRIRKQMIPIAAVGVALTVVGLAALACQGITYTSRESLWTLVLFARRRIERTMPVSVLGIMAVAVGRTGGRTGEPARRHQGKAVPERR